ncbi:unnamed protein product [Arctogadus glacialis]
MCLGCFHSGATGGAIPGQSNSPQAPQAPLTSLRAQHWADRGSRIHPLVKDKTGWHVGQPACGCQRVSQRDRTVGGWTSQHSVHPAPDKLETAHPSGPPPSRQSQTCSLPSPPASNRRASMASGPPVECATGPRGLKRRRRGYKKKTQEHKDCHEPLGGGMLRGDAWAWVLGERREPR